MGKSEEMKRERWEGGEKKRLGEEREKEESQNCRCTFRLQEATRSNDRLTDRRTLWGWEVVFHVEGEGGKGSVVKVQGKVGLRVMHVQRPAGGTGA